MSSPSRFISERPNPSSARYGKWNTPFNIKQRLNRSVRIEPLAASFPPLVRVTLYNNIHLLYHFTTLSCTNVVENWKNNEFNKINDLSEKNGAKIYFLDEAGVRTDYHAGTTWSLGGLTPIIPSTGRRYCITNPSCHLSMLTKFLPKYS
ncbi:hypothetical protein CCP3SC5AM1_1110009 [Gammaproteobacteria bacterium]